MRKGPGSVYDRWNISVKIPIGIQSPKSNADNTMANMYKDRETRTLVIHVTCRFIHVKKSTISHE